ncbi:MAG TPA: septum formation initiator family protein [Treponemataceae bacterium]|nr:septum formation initiator family protein [Treponemataceae bacterium]
MKRFKFVIPIFIGTLVYCILLITVGPKGIWPMKQLEKEIGTLTKHVEILRTIENDLSIQVQNLTADPDTISIYAHEIGYVAEGEKLIKLSGFTGGINRNINPGITLKRDSTIYLPDWSCKLFGLLSAIISLAFSLYLTSHKQKLFS